MASVVACSAGLSGYLVAKICPCVVVESSAILTVLGKTRLAGSALVVASDFGEGLSAVARDTAGLVVACSSLWVTLPLLAGKVDSCARSAHSSQDTTAVVVIEVVSVCDDAVLSV